MKIAIVGGTGDLGEALVFRLAVSGHRVIIGSRKAETASAAVMKCKKILAGFETVIYGLENPEAVKEADVVVISVPYKHVESTIEAIRPNLTSNQIIVSVVVPMEKEGKFFRYTPPKEGSTAMQIKNLLPGMKMVAAFQNVSAKRLSVFEKEIYDIDIPVCGNSEDAIRMVCELAKEIGLKPKIAGPIEISASIEAITPLLLNVAIMNEEKDLGIKFC